MGVQRLSPGKRQASPYDGLGHFRTPISRGIHHPSIWLQPPDFACRDRIWGTHEPLGAQVRPLGNHPSGPQGSATTPKPSGENSGSPD